VSAVDSVEVAREELATAAITTIRGLSMDAVERANSGHPGLPLAMAPAAYVLFARVMKHDPSAPDWPDRDRFVLSAGHGSMLLYSVLHLAGYDLPLAELERFRQWGSRTPGHPERSSFGIETTTGPLGQGFANGVGMAMAERFLRDRYGGDVCDHHVFALCSDGDLMEGVSAEAASLAGHLGLGRLVYLYDDNRITIDGPTDLAFATEDVEARFAAYGWHTLAVDDANDVDALETAILAARAEEDRPSLVRVRSVIGWPAPTKAGTAKAHGAPLGAEEVAATKLRLGLDPDASFAVPAEARDAFADARERGAVAREAWNDRQARWRASEPEAAREWDAAWRGEAPADLAERLPDFGHDPLATRAAGGKAMQALTALVPTMVGGAADLVESTKTRFDGEDGYTRAAPGRNVHWGVREHAMGSAVNGLALHGGIVKPYGATFLVFADYMRPAIRLSALIGLPVVWVFTHDSIGVGEDGPTHQPVEHLAALRAIPNLVVIRPADAAETAQAWGIAMGRRDGPVCLVLTRQAVPTLDRDALAGAEGLGQGAYVLAEARDGRPDAVLAASGSEVALALKASDALAAEGIAARVVSMPSWELFDAQPAEYREAVLPAALPVVSVEAGVEQGWSRYADASVSVDRFGASAPGPEVFRGLEVTGEAAAAAVRGLIRSRRSG
jgi:transketolase